MPTRNTIANDALKLLGQKLIPSLDYDREDARVLKSAFPDSARACMEEGVWNFALKRAKLAISGDVPAFGYARYFAKPADCLRVAFVASTSATGDYMSDYSDELGYIASNDADCYIGYVSSVYLDRVGDWTSKFADFVSADLALRCCARITGSQDLRKHLENVRRATKSAALGLDASQNPSRPMRVGRWSLAGRRRGIGYRDPQGKF